MPISVNLHVEPVFVNLQHIALEQIRDCLEATAAQARHEIMNRKEIGHLHTLRQSPYLRTKYLDRFHLTYLLVGVLAASLATYGQATKNDIPSIAREALKSVVTVKTKDGLGKPLAQGSGFLVSNDGKVVTNYHVINGAASAEVLLSTGASYTVAGLLSSNQAHDLALLKIKTTSDEFRFLALGDSDKVQVGEQVVALGSPLGLEGTVSPGFVSGVRDLNGITLLQTTAPISPGNSGGALINLTGQVVGVPTSSLTLVEGKTTVSQNLNFAVPSKYVHELVGEAASEARSLVETLAQDRSNVAARSTKEMVTGAKTICVWVPSGNPVLKTELTGKLLEWGKLELVSSPENADLILKVVQTGELNLATGAGNQAAALLTDRASGVELWSKTKGGGWAMSGYSNAWVARDLAKEFIKFFDSQIRGTKK